MRTALWVLLAAFIGLSTARAEESRYRIGGGVNYWTVLNNIDVENVDKDGFSYFASYQYRPTLIGLQADLEFLPDRFGQDAIAPAAYVLLGQAIYAAAGAGILNVDGEWADDPFFALKAGLDLEVLPRIFLDVSASYRFDSKTKLKDAVDNIDTDTVFLGAAVRLGF